MQGACLGPLLPGLLQLLALLLEPGIELLRPLELGLQGTPLPLCGNLVGQQLLLAQRGLLQHGFNLLQLGRKLAYLLLLLLHLQGEAGKFVVIGTGHLGLLGAGKLFPPGRRLAMGRLGGGKRLLPLPAGLQLGGNPSVEIPQVLQQLTLLLLVLEAGGETQLLGDPVLARFVVHQGHVTEPLLYGCQRLLLGPCPLMGLDGDGGVELGARHPLEQGGALIGARLEEGGELPLRQDDGAAELLPRKPHQLVDAILQLPLAAGEDLPRLDVSQAALLSLEAPLRAIAGTAYRPARKPDAAVAAAELHLGTAAGVAAAQDAAHVVGLELLLVIRPAHLGHVLAIGDEARHLVIEAEADGVEQCALARACIAGDGKEPGSPQSATGEIDGESPGQAGQVFPCKRQDFHGLDSFTCSRISSNDATNSAAGSPSNCR